MSETEQIFEIFQLEETLNKKFLIREIKYGVNIKKKNVMDFFDGNQLLKNVFEEVCNKITENTSANLALMKPKKIQICFNHNDLHRPIKKEILELKYLTPQLLFDMVRFNSNGKHLDLQTFGAEFEILFTIYNEPHEINFF